LRASSVDRLKQKEERKVRKEIAIAMIIIYVVVDARHQRVTCFITRRVVDVTRMSRDADQIRSRSVDNESGCRLFLYDATRVGIRRLFIATSRVHALL